MKKDSENNSSGSIPPPPPLPFNSDFFKTTLNADLFRTKFRKSLPRDTDEETTKSFDAVVNELKSKFTKIKLSLNNATLAQPSGIENLIKLNKANLGSKSSIAIGICSNGVAGFKDLIGAAAKKSTKSFTNIDADKLALKSLLAQNNNSNNNQNNSNSNNNNNNGSNNINNMANASNKENDLRRLNEKKIVVESGMAPNVAKSGECSSCANPGEEGII